eukprot:s434_g15.t1
MSTCAAGYFPSSAHDDGEVILLHIELISGEGFTLEALTTTCGREVQRLIRDRLVPQNDRHFQLHHNGSAVVSHQTLKEQGIVGPDAAVNCTFLPTDLYAAWCYTQGTPVSDGEFAMDGVTQLRGAPEGRYLQNLPQCLECLAFDGAFNDSLDGLTLPNRLQSLTFGQAFNQSLNDVTFPNSLQTLTFGAEFDQSLKDVTFPQGLQSLTFGAGFDQSLEGVVLPQGLQSLTFGRWFNQSLNHVTLPSSLRNLVFDDGFDQSLKDVTLPPGLQSLTFGEEFNQSLEGVTLPGALQNLTFGKWFDQSLEPVTLPQGLQSLTFGESFNQSLEGVSLPTGLQKLTFGLMYNKSLQGVVLPQALQSLTLGEIFNQSLKGVTFPDSLQRLVFDLLFNQSLEGVTLPDGLQELILSEEFDQSLKHVTLPRGLQSLSFGRHFNQILLDVTFPDSLQTLTFGDDFDRSLQNVAFPNSLQTLTFGDGFDQSLKDVTLPPGLQSLTFGGDFNQSLESVTLPGGLKNLTLGEEFDQSLKRVTLPQSLQSFTFRGSNQSLEGVSLPDGLESLILGDDFDPSLVSVTLPQGLQSLAFGEGFDRSLQGLTLPDGLKSLIFGFRFNQSLEGVTLPDNLQRLKFGYYFNKRLDNVTLPQGLQALTLNPLFNQSLEGVTLPSGLQTLTFGYQFDQDLEQGALPRTLLELELKQVFLSCPALAIYYPQFYFKQIEMEEFDARPDRYGPSVIGKYTKGIGMIEARYCTDDEDPVSFSMTVTHRLIDRMEKEGFNETYRYMPDGNRLPCWNSVGRLDIGSESLIDRSKSMKAYVMDLFERYGSGEGNIEGVDMYNACYGGQLLSIKPQMMRLHLFRQPWLSRRSAGALCGAPPPWWQRGWPRQRVGSVAEAELLAPLAEVLMPQMPIAELFRSFPSPKGWGGNYLEPDLAAYGVLKDANAALFVEYDGYWRHGEREGMERDRMKNAALLKYAPRGSYVVRISHNISLPLQDNVLWVYAQTWRSGSAGRVSRVHGDIIEQTVTGMKHKLCPQVMERLQLQIQNGKNVPPAKVIDFIKGARSEKPGNTMDEVSQFLASEGFSTMELDMMLGKAPLHGMLIEEKLWPTLQWLLDLGVSKGQLAKIVSSKPQILRLSIEQNLKPTAQWLLDFGLTKSQVAKAVATHPGILGYSIEHNLKPTVHWLLDLGLTQNQVAKAVATHASILGYSIEQKLKPTAVATHPSILGYSVERNLKSTVQWLLDLGLTKSQVAKTIATHPSILGYSIEQNLKPTVQCFLGLGLTQSQAAKAVAAHPGILGYSIAHNLKPTVQWFLDLGLTTSQAAKVVATYPSILGCSIEQNLMPTAQWFLDLGLTKTQVAKAVATHASILGLGIEQNLKPTVQWFLDLGLTQNQVAKAVATHASILGYSIEQKLKPTAIATHPSILGYSVERNLKSTVQWLLDLRLTKSQVAKAIATHPSILGYSIEQKLKPTVQWFLDLGLTQNQVAKAIATHPSILGYGVERNLKSTVQWLLDLGLTQNQVAKAVATHASILGYSIEKKLKPTLQWFLDLGLTQNQVAKAVATHPGILGYSIEQNLKPTVQWFLDLGLTKSQAAKVVAIHPQMLGLDIDGNLTATVQWFLDLGLTKSKVAEAVAKHPPMVWYSIEQNLKPTVYWFLDLGMTRSQVAQAVAIFPQLLGCSIVRNLHPKIVILNHYFTAHCALELVAKWPPLLGYSYQRLTSRLKILAEQDQLAKLTGAMSLREEAFQKRFVTGAKERYTGDCYLPLCFGMVEAAGLCAQNWVESDRWDGRYAIAIATDISDAPFEVIFSVGAACTAALYYPDAPLPHHSHRASCILHRFDFFKPVGWFHMGPVVDGKYSIDAYMNCVDACYQTLKHKMNGRPLLSITDYNVFHTGGGYHVVKKAFERCIRAEDPKTKAEVRERYVQEKLLPSVNLLKIIGPCHTVSSFLNISSVVMTKWEEALGKILLVFTYGSGCASSMYQLRFDDMAWFDPLAVWKVKQFYRNAIHVSPDLRLHQVYIDTWMKFDYRPHGRISFGFGYDSYELDAYYLLEIDPWGRRFYHRGGMRTGPMNRKVMNATALNYDKVENRHTREHFGQLPPNGEAWEKQENKEEKAARSLEDTWREIEHEMTFEPEVEVDGAPSVVAEKVSQGRTLVVREIGAPDDDDDEEGAETSYQIVGTWTAMREPQQMSKSASGAFTYEVTLGPNGWEQFYLLRNNSWSKKIYPAMHKSWKDMPCVGPHKGRERQMCWQLSGRPGWDLPGEDEAPVGSRFCITFTPGQVKRLTWEKLEEEPQKMPDDATYQILGSWSCFDPQEMTPDPSRPGVHTAEVQCNRLGLKFHFLRNQDYCQNLAPVVEEGYGTLYSAVAPIGQQNAGRLWQIEAQDGEVYRIELHRSVDDPSDVSVRWQKVDSRPSQVVDDRYFLVGSFNRWGYAFEPFELTLNGDVLEAEVQVQSLPLKFQIIENMAEDQRLYPDDKDCCSEEHNVCGPEAQSREWCWSLDNKVCNVGDTVTVSLQLQPEKKVSWRKAE